MKFSITTVALSALFAGVVVAQIESSVVDTIGPNDLPSSLATDDPSATETDIGGSGVPSAPTSVPGAVSSTALGSAAAPPLSTPLSAGPGPASIPTAVSSTQLGGLPSITSRPLSAAVSSSSSAPRTTSSTTQRNGVIGSAAGQSGLVLAAMGAVVGLML